MVKPQVLTHVIEGYVIQESSEPFAVNRGYNDSMVKKMAVKDVLGNGEPPRKKHCNTIDDEKKTSGDVESNESNGDSSLSPGDTPDNQNDNQEDDTPKINPRKWTVRF